MERKGYIPPYTLTDKTVMLIAEITEIITRLSVTTGSMPNPRLRKENRVKTIQASLAIENNTLSLEQVTDIIGGKRVLGSPKEICEVKNAFEAYERLLSMDPFSIESLLKAHRLLMTGLSNEAGGFRKGGVGVFAIDRLVHMAPPAGRVPEQMDSLHHWLREANDVHPLVSSSVFHYELEFVHPFADGNGRMGRMWQTLILHRWRPVFGWLPIETVIKDRQEDYYRVLGNCDKRGNSGEFVEFILKAIYDSLIELEETEQVNRQVTEQVERLLTAMGNDTLSTRELMGKLHLRHRPSFRDNYLLPALELGIVEMTVPEKPNSSRQKYRRSKGLPC